MMYETRLNMTVSTVCAFGKNTHDLIFPLNQSSFEGFLFRFWICIQIALVMFSLSRMSSFHVDEEFHREHLYPKLGYTLP